MTEQSSREQHLEQQVEKLNNNIEALHAHYKDADIHAQLRGWAIDRAIRIKEINKEPIGIAALEKLAESLYEYCTPEPFSTDGDV